MKHRHHQRPIPRAAALSVGIAFALCTMGAFAEEAPQSSEEQVVSLDRIQVTGSRVMVPGLETSSPVMSVERDEFLRTQPVAVEEFVRQLPSAVPSIGPGTNNGTAGAAQINLRGLGANRTLVLIDGRRPVPFNLLGVVDTNTIPLALLQGVDVLTGGASVVYGADAVSGVANFILRRDFEGVELMSSYGQSSQGDAARQRTELTMGANLADGRGNAVLSFGYTEVDPLMMDRRSYGEVSRSSVTGAGQGSGTTVPAVFNLPGGLRQIDPETGELTTDVTPYNYSPLNYYQTSLDRYQATGLARFEISDSAEAYAEMRYVRSRVNSLIAPSGLFLSAADVPVANPFIPEPARQQLCQFYDIDDCTTSSTATFENLVIGRRMTELGPRYNNHDTKTFQVTAGLRGSLGDRWAYDGYWSHGESDQLQERRNWGSLSKTRQALLAVDRDSCVDPTGGCVPLNVWGPEGSITDEMADFINLSAYLGQSVKQTNAALNFSGDLGNFSSPWSYLPIGVAAGMEYRKTDASTFADAASQITGEVMGTGAPRPDREGHFSLNEAYAEMIVPLINERPGIHSLSMELGYRHSDFATSAGTGENYGSYKYGMDWAPTETLRFRTMNQRATRAPNINELFGPQVTGLSNLAVDPCGGDAINQAEANTPGTLSNLCRLTGVPLSFIGSLSQPSAGQVNVLTGGNLGLSPELADTRTVGLVWSPADNFALTLDYWDIEVNESIGSPTMGDVMDGCYSTAFNPNREFNDFCALMGRSTITGTFNGEAIGVGLALSNQGRDRRAGLDLGARYGFDLAPGMGRLDFAFDLARTTRNRYQATPTSIDRDCLGYYSTSCTPNHKYKSILRTTWSANDLALSLNWRYTSGLEAEPASTPAAGWFEDYRSIPSYNYFDLSASYRTPFNADISLSVNNVLDKQPPIVGDTIGVTSQNSGNTFPQFYDVLGRYFTLGITFKFD